jgi:hypothetical protein
MLIQLYDWINVNSKVHTIDGDVGGYEWILSEQARILGKGGYPGRTAEVLTRQTKKDPKGNTIECNEITLLVNKIGLRKY